MSFLSRIIGIDKLIESQEETNKLLKDIYIQNKRMADLTDKHNKAYHIK